MNEKTMAQSLTIENMADFVAREIKKIGIPKWDLYLLDQHIYGMYLNKANEELQTDSRNLNYYLRVFTPKENHQMGVGLIQSCSSRSDDIEKTIKLAKSIAELNIGPEYDLVVPGLKYPTPKTTDKEVMSDPKAFLRTKGADIRRALQENLFVEPTFGKFRTYFTQKMLLNSNGLRLTKPSTYFCYEFSLKAMKDGELAEYWPKGYLKTVADLKFDEYIPQWATIARDTLRAKSPITQKSIDVVFPPIIVRIALLNTLGYSATASALYDKTSQLNVGEKVASEDFTMFDDGLLLGGLNTSAWDGEGNPKQTTTIIDHGIMKQHLYDQKYSKLMKGKPTGNGTRDPGRGGVVDISMNNLVISPGNRSLRDIVKDIKQGVYIAEFSWLNPDEITGMFGAEIRNGYMITDGQLGDPIKGGILSGNLYEMVKDIGGISKETHNIMNANVPFLHFKNGTLSGK